MGSQVDIRRRDDRSSEHGGRGRRRYLMAHRALIATASSSMSSMWSSSSRRALPTKRSAAAFMFGARTAVRITFAPTPCAAPSNSGRQLRPQPLHGNQNPGPDSRDTRHAHPPLGARARVAYRATCAHQLPPGLWWDAHGGQHGRLWHVDRAVPPDQPLLRGARDEAPGAVEELPAHQAVGTM
jgi:hypothetical protein